MTRVTTPETTVHFDRIIARRMKAMRRDAGLSGPQIAERLGCAYSTVRSWENATRRPMIVDVYRWADACQRHVHTILDAHLLRGDNPEEGM